MATKKDEKKELIPLIKKKSTLVDKSVENKERLNFGREIPSPYEGLKIEKAFNPENEPGYVRKTITYTEDNTQDTHSTQDAQISKKKSPILPIKTPVARKNVLQNRDFLYYQKTMKTQKMSLDTLLKLDILDTFLRTTEEITDDRKVSINEKIELLIQSFLNTRLSSRQAEGFLAIYKSYLDDELKG